MQSRSQQNVKSAVKCSRWFDEKYMKQKPEMLEVMPPDIALWLYKIGFLRCGLDYPRWKSRIYAAEVALSDWRFYPEVTKSPAPRRMAIRAILYQPFSGVRPEWAEIYTSNNSTLSK